jgi:hypothetical protein
MPVSSNWAFDHEDLYDHDLLATALQIGDSINASTIKLKPFTSLSVYDFAVLVYEEDEDGGSGAWDLRPFFPLTLPLSSSSGVVTLPLDGNTHVLQLTENVSSMVLTAPSSSSDYTNFEFGAKLVVRAPSSGTYTFSAIPAVAKQIGPLAYNASEFTMESGDEDITIIITKNDLGQAVFAAVQAQ